MRDEAVKNSAVPPDFRFLYKTALDTFNAGLRPCFLPTAAKRWCSFSKLLMRLTAYGTHSLKRCLKTTVLYYCLYLYNDTILRPFCQVVNFNVLPLTLISQLIPIICNIFCINYYLTFVVIWFIIKPNPTFI